MRTILRSTSRGSLGAGSKFVRTGLSVYYVLLGMPRPWLALDEMLIKNTRCEMNERQCLPRPPYFLWKVRANYIRTWVHACTGSRARLSCLQRPDDRAMIRAPCARRHIALFSPVPGTDLRHPSPCPRHPDNHSIHAIQMGTVCSSAEAGAGGCTGAVTSHRTPGNLEPPSPPGQVPRLSRQSCLVFPVVPPALPAASRFAPGDMYTAHTLRCRPKEVRLLRAR